MDVSGDSPCSESFNSSDCRARISTPEAILKEARPFVTLYLQKYFKGFREEVKKKKKIHFSLFIYVYFIGGSDRMGICPVKPPDTKHTHNDQSLT